MRGWRSQKGAVAPLVAILLTLLIICVALVVDVGHLHNTRIQLQRAVDAAALAGALQIKGDVDQESRATSIAQAAVQQNKVLGRNVSLADDNITVELGYWDTSEEAILGQKDYFDSESPTEDAAAARFASPPGEGQEINAVRVRATTTVDHIFFFFLDSTDIHANAIALNQLVNQSLPLAVISCIPATGPEKGNIDVYGIKHYTFSSNENTAGWTSLTLGDGGGTREPDIEALLTEEGLKLFNSVVKSLNETAIVGRPADYDPATNTDYSGCEGNVDTTINCGLGRDPSVAFEAGDPSIDPLLRYDGLPNYITEDNEAGDIEFDAFLDILSQRDSAGNDWLLKRSGDDNTTYQNRLKDLYYGDENPFGDTRFKADDPDSGKGEHFIHRNNSGQYIPIFNKVLDYVGYPPVSASTGSMSAVINNILIPRLATTSSDKKDGRFKAELSGEYYPFTDEDSGASKGLGETLRFNIPVIFASSCDNFDPKSFKDGPSPTAENQELHYIGIARFVVTRIWQEQDCYQTPVPVEFLGDASLINWPLVDNKFACPVANPQPPILFEGLLRPPVDDDDKKGTDPRVYLVH